MSFDIVVSSSPVLCKAVQRHRLVSKLCQSWKQRPLRSRPKLQHHPGLHYLLRLLGRKPKPSAAGHTQLVVVFMRGVHANTSHRAGSGALPRMHHMKLPTRQRAPAGMLCVGGRLDSTSVHSRD